LDDWVAATIPPLRERCSHGANISHSGRDDRAKKRLTPKTPALTFVNRAQG